MSIRTGMARAILPLVLCLSIATEAIPQAVSYTPAAAKTLEQRVVSEENDYLTKKAYPLKAGVCFTFDDGDTTFYTQVVAVLDSIAQANADTIQIKATTAIMVTNAQNAYNTTASMSWDQIASLDQSKYEVAIHGTNEQRLGSRNTGFSKTYLDTNLKAWQDSLEAHNVPKARSLLLANHRYIFGVEDVFLKHGIYNVFGVVSPVSQDTAITDTGIASEMIPTIVNYDPWVKAMVGAGSFDLHPFIRPGGVKSRWTPLGREGWNWSQDDVASIKQRINAAIQSGTILNFAFHSVRDDTAEVAGDYIRISKNAFREIMIYTEHMMKQGVLNSYTAEEAMARGVGYVTGALLPHYNFKRLTDLVPAAADTGTLMQNSSIVPLMWPLKHETQEFRVATTDTFALGTDASKPDNWKVWDLTAQVDTVEAVFIDNSLAAESTSYGGAEDGGRVLVANVQDATNHRSNPIPLFIRTTGVNSNYIDVYVQMMYVLPSVTISREDAYLAARLFQWKERYNDSSNDIYTSYDFTLSTVKTGTVDPANITIASNRIIPKFSIIAADTALGRSAVDAGAFSDDTSGEILKFGGFLTPYIMDNQGAVDLHSPWGGYEDLASSSLASRVTGADLQPARLLNIAAEMNFGYAHWITYHMQVEIDPNDTDWVAGFIYFRTAGNSGTFTGTTANVGYIISNIQAVAGV